MNTMLRDADLESQDVRDTVLENAKLFLINNHLDSRLNRLYSLQEWEELDSIKDDLSDEETGVEIEEDEEEELWIDDDSQNQSDSESTISEFIDYSDYQVDIPSLKDIVGRFDSEVDDSEEIEIEPEEWEEESPDNLIEELVNRPILKGVTTLWSNRVTPFIISENDRQQIQIRAGIRTKPKTVLSEQNTPLAKIMKKRAGIKTGKRESPTRLIIENLDEKRKIEEIERSLLSE